MLHYLNISSNDTKNIQKDIKSFDKDTDIAMTLNDCLLNSIRTLSGMLIKMIQ